MAAANTSLRPFIENARLREMNRDLAARISADYEKLLDDGSELLVIVTLKGALFFAADMLRELTIPTRIDFVRLSSYGAGTTSSGTIRVIKDIECSPQGRHVLILDEIADTGRTLQFLVDRLKAAGPASVRLCSLLSKPSRREIPIHLDYVGMDIEDHFVVGYGLDFGEKYRNLNDVFILEQH